MSYDPNPFLLKYRCQMCGVIFDDYNIYAENQAGLDVVHEVMDLMSKDIACKVNNGLSIKNKCVHKCSDDCYGIGTFLGAQLYYYLALYFMTPFPAWQPCVQENVFYTYHYFMRDNFHEKLPLDGVGSWN